MSTRLPDADRVGRLVREVASAELLPRFRRLGAHDIHAKPSATDPDDIVTEADLAVERRLGPELVGLLPGSVVIGEEAAATNPRLVDLLAGAAPVWLLDPLDGTRNFAAGRDTFGTMVALVLQRETVMSWIYLPKEDVMFAAERGAGAFVDGQRLRTGAPTPGTRRSGTAMSRFMPAPLREQVLGRAAATTAPREPAGSAAIEYTALMRGEGDFVVYYRLHPWDHAPGALLLTEAGGASRHPDGQPYRPGDRDQPTLLTRHAGIWQEMRDLLFGD